MARQFAEAHAAHGEWLEDLAFEEAGRRNLSFRTKQRVASAREKLFLQEVEQIVQKHLRGRYVAPRSAPKGKGRVQRVLNVMLSDLHYGAQLWEDEGTHTYGPKEEARRTAAVVAQVASYKSQYRDETALNIHLMGDIIQGQLHDQRDGAPQAAQMCAAMHILGQSIGYLAQHFRQIDVYCTPGNHGRNKLRHPERATNQKWDSLETTIYFALSRELLRGATNVRFHIPKTPYYLCRMAGQVAFMTHGDTVLKPGYPGRSINVKDIRRQVNEWSASAHELGLSRGEQIRLFGVGHVHIGNLTHLPEGAVFLSNGCLIPPDGFSLSIGASSVACGQWMWESVEGHIMGDSRFVTVDREIDRNAALDKIVRPFEGY